jgi:hypothetical protein
MIYMKRGGEKRGEMRGGVRCITVQISIIAYPTAFIA